MLLIKTSWPQTTWSCCSMLNYMLFFTQVHFCQVSCSLLTLMCSHRTTICHVVFSPVVMGPVGPSVTGKEHDISL